MSAKTMTPDEKLWQESFDLFKSQGASDYAAARNADHVTYGKQTNSAKFKPKRTRKKEAKP